MTAWTETEDNTLKALWVKGHSSYQISEELARRSRAAVIGRAHRLGLPYHDDGPKNQAGKEKRRDKQRQEFSVRSIRRSAGGTSKKQSLPKKPRKADPPALAPNSQPVGIADLNRGMCKWPVTDGEPWKYCGAPADGSYCAFHKSLSVRS